MWGWRPQHCPGYTSLTVAPAVLQIREPGYFNRLRGTGLGSSDPNPSVLAAGRAASVPNGPCSLPPCGQPPISPGPPPLPGFPAACGGSLRPLHACLSGSPGPAARPSGEGRRTGGQRALHAGRGSLPPWVSCCPTGSQLTLLQLQLLRSLGRAGLAEKEGHGPWPQCTAGPLLSSFLSTAPDPLGLQEERECLQGRKASWAVPGVPRSQSRPPPVGVVGPSQAPGPAGRLGPRVTWEPSSQAPEAGPV